MESSKAVLNKFSIILQDFKYKMNQRKKTIDLHNYCLTINLTNKKYKINIIFKIKKFTIYLYKYFF